MSEPVLRDQYKNRVGQWMQTRSGRAFWPLDPRADEIDCSDVAHALSNLCRYGGHTREFYCPTDDQRVLTADLRWVPAGDLRVGDELLGFDEHPFEFGSAGTRRRRFRPSRVLTALPVTRRVIRLEMADGSTVRASEEHPWLVATKRSRNQKWCTAKEVAVAIAAGHRRYMHKFIEPWAFTPSREAGWLAGIYDGEGYLSVINRHGTQLGVSQKPGLVLDEITRVLYSLGFTALYYNQTGSPTGDVQTIQMRGGWRSVLRLLGSVRPIRLLDKFGAFLRAGEFNKQLDGAADPMEIVRAYDEGVTVCAGLETSSRTYLCEGYGAHNSVAQHAVILSRAVEERGGTVNEAYYGLHHDDAEAYLVDLPRPVKNYSALGDEYRRIEAAIMACVVKAFGLLPEMPAIVAELDSRVMIMTEKRDLMAPPPMAWVEDGTAPLEKKIIPWTPTEACAMFQGRHEHLIILRAAGITEFPR